MSTHSIHSDAAEVKRLRALADVRRSIKQAVAAGASWNDIIRVMAESGPTDEPKPVDAHRRSA
jgi:hypothetical protein